MADFLHDSGAILQISKVYRLQNHDSISNVGKISFRGTYVPGSLPHGSLIGTEKLPSEVIIRPMALSLRNLYVKARTHFDNLLGRT